ncbi:uncharacterized protein LOC115050140 isoform X2 [Echeneis naucrates]|uniref:uncharacterized protein LOC115050140 isoform X2 n=1 Tax=Echeneis naucrates TaxID=173247 RepID=UPI001113ED72|nr:uncharacterized protein C4orf50 homolog isoform X2 [Echeneis naucrates]
MEQHQLNPDSTGTTKKTDVVVGTEDSVTQRCQITTCKENSIQEQSYQMSENESLRAKLNESQKELQRRHNETMKMYSELCQTEARRDEAERKAADEAEKVIRLTDAAIQMEESRRENEILNAQVKELRTKLRGLVQEKTDALTFKTQIEEQYKILTAQLKAKTVALEELNSEYIAVKGEQVSKDDLSSALMSLQSRYNNIRAKYNTLLKGRSQTDLDLAPLKAKLSCLVVKCQERNSLLVQMMKTMQIHGCADSTLKQRVDQLLSDVVLQDYTAVFTPGSAAKTEAFTPRFISALQDHHCTIGSKPDQMCAAECTPENKQLQIGITPESEAKCRELKSDEHISISIGESSTNLQDSRREVSTATTKTRKEKVNSPVPTVQQQENVPESFPVTAVLPAQMLPFAGGADQPIKDPENFGLHHPDVKGKPSPDVATSARSPRSQQSPTSPSCGTHTGRSRRLSSPEKIINLHEQLQKTLMSSCLAPSSRGRGHEPRKSLSFSAPADVNLNSRTNKPSPSFNKLHSSLTVTTSVQAQHTPVVTTKSAATNKSVTLFNAVASRAATLNPNIFTYNTLKEVTSKTTEYNLSSSSNCPFAATVPNEAASTDVTMSPIQTKKVTALPKVSDAIDLGSETNSKATASDKTAPHDGLVFAAPCAQSAHHSTERSNKSDRKTAAALDKTARPRPGAPAEVRSAEVIKTVGQSSLMIGWERPPLDELGCSNGTFVYGYRVFIDGNFHKSVMSSACTKCIVENVDLGFPIHISVQTLGDNGLTSNSVHTTYRTSVRADQH